MPTKVHLVKAMVFPVVMYGCESWTVKKAEHWRIDGFELWCWRRLLRLPWTARRSVLGVHWKDWCWSWNSSTLATWWEELTHWKRPWCWEGLGAGREGDDRGWDGWIASQTRWARVTPGVCDVQRGLACCSSWGCRVGNDWATELNNTCKFQVHSTAIQKHMFVIDVHLLCPVWLLVTPSTPGFPALHCFLEFAQTPVRWVSDAVRPARPLYPFSCPHLGLSFCSLTGGCVIPTLVPCAVQQVGVGYLFYTE